MAQLLDILNLKGYQNDKIGSKFSAILHIGWILHIGAVASGSVCNQWPEMAGIVSNSWNWVDLLNMARHGLKWLEMAGNDLKWLELQKMAGMNENG